MQNLVEAFYKWYRNTLRNTRYRWLIVFGTLLYLLSPLDISPDFIPVIGWIDDGILVTLLVSEVSQLAAEYLNKRRQQVPDQAASTFSEPAIDVQVD
ncbi:YkvA family protein [Almyronema epifaneia]|uniref:YkvA family protein n=1 Tax=Almyronema epifaneia S1 TaxID=2991925 RepID=A0ABW6IBE1_9CYAN